MDVPLFKQFVLLRGERRLVVGEEDLQTNRIASVFKVSVAKLVILFAVCWQSKLELDWCAPLN